MPYLRIQTNLSIKDDKLTALLNQASQSVSEHLNKSENYVMVELNRNCPMLFAGSADDLAYLELKSINLPQEQTPKLSLALCHLLNQELGIRQDRIYIEFTNIERQNWGWNGKTF